MIYDREKNTMEYKINTRIRSVRNYSSNFSWMKTLRVTIRPHPFPHFSIISESETESLLSTTPFLKPSIIVSGTKKKGFNTLYNFYHFE